MENDLITTDEINLLKTSPRHLSWKDVVPGIGVNPPIKSTKLESGYMISYTIDSIFNDNNVKLEHVMVGADGFEPDPADADEIVRAIIGECARAPPSWSSQEGYTHYIKLIGIDSEELKRFYETGIEMGIEMGVTCLEVKK